MRGTRKEEGGYSLHIRPGNTVWFGLTSPDGKRKNFNPPDRTVASGAWTHVAATFDGARMRVFVNGREAGGGMDAPITIRKTGQPLRVGWLGSYGFFNGCVRDAALFGRPLSPAEVYAEYSLGKIW